MPRFGFKRKRKNVETRKLVKQLQLQKQSRIDKIVASHSDKLINKAG